jgi:TonB-dependent SusC/RagA subfamily outer membrane receptor
VPPGNIRSISVLKGDVAKALYGSRGAAGVVLVKTSKAPVHTLGYMLGPRPAPLYIVDHEIVDSVYIARQLKPNSIKRMTVLKGESAVNRFGEKAKNGALIIETRRPADADSISK